MNTGTLTISNYRRMVTARGLGFAVEFFREAHLFDLRFGTDTAGELALEDFGSSPGEGIEHGVYYGASWTSEVRRQFAYLRRRLGVDFVRHTLVDVGCGKGKVALVWGRELLREGLEQRVVGIDYCEPLVSIARENLGRVPHGGEIDFLYGDVREVDYEGLGTPLIMWAFNPFNAYIFGELQARLVQVPTILVYNNPVHRDELLEAGWRLITETSSSTSDHPRTRTSILRNTAHPGFS